MLVSAMINANVFGVMANLVQDVNSRDVKFQEKYDTANTAMANMKFNSKTCIKIRAFIITTQATQDQQEELENFLKDVSPSLRFKVLVEIFQTSMKYNMVLNQLFNDYGIEKVVPFLVPFWNSFGPKNVPQNDPKIGPKVLQKVSKNWSKK